MARAPQIAAFNVEPADPQLLALRVPPHSVEAEQSLLGGLLLDNSAWEKIADLVSVDDFYRERLVAHDIELLPPALETVDTLDRIIYDELVQGKATRQAERELKTIIVNLERQGAEAIVLGCTELEMVVDVDANVLPIYDCTRIHCEAAAAWILGDAKAK